MSATVKVPSSLEIAQESQKSAKHKNPSGSLTALKKHPKSLFRVGAKKEADIVLPGWPSEDIIPNFYAQKRSQRSGSAVSCE